MARPATLDTDRQNTYRKSKTLPLALLLLAFSGVLTGCNKTSSMAFGRDQGAGKLSKQDLRDAINDFEGKAVTLISLSGQESDRSAANDNAKKTALLQRIRMIQAIHTMAGIEDPAAAYVELWTLCVRIRLYVDEGAGTELSGPSRQIAAAMAKELEADIETLGRSFLSPQAFEATQKQVLDFAKLHPIKGNFANVAVFATQTKPGESSPFQNILSIPMAPFRAMEGVDRGASAIYSLRDSANNISGIIEQLPESSRWQALLFIMEMEDTEMAKTVLTNMTQMSQSSARLADAADTLPGKIRQEASTLVTEIDAKQANLQVTLAKTESTAAALEKTLAQADKTIAALNETAHSFSATSRDWEAAASATGSTVTILRDWANQPAKESTGKPFDVNDYKELAVEINKTAVEVKATLAEARTLLGQDGNGGAIGEIDKRLSSQINGITWRLAGLAVFAFALAVAYKRITSRWKAQK
jgi:hypothetical protein